MMREKGDDEIERNDGKQRPLKDDDEIERNPGEQLPLKGGALENNDL